MTEPERCATECEVQAFGLSLENDMSLHYSMTKHDNADFQMLRVGWANGRLACHTLGASPGLLAGGAAHVLHSDISAERNSASTIDQC